MKTKITITCEHAGYRIPPPLAKRVKLSATILRSHRGWDAGALTVAQVMQARLKGKLFYFVYTRLCIDANRSLDNGALRASDLSLEQSEKAKLEAIYRKYRKKILHRVGKNKQSNLVFSIHSFVPRFNGKTRSTGIGILFRPWEKNELALAHKLKKSLLKNSSQKIAVHFNRPYRGFTDCLLNDVLDANKNATGVFLEINQRLLKNRKQMVQIGNLLAEAIKESTES